MLCMCLLYTIVCFECICACGVLGGVFVCMHVVCVEPFSVFIHVHVITHTHTHTHHRGASSDSQGGCEGVLSCAFSPDEEIFVTTSQNGLVRVRYLSLSFFRVKITVHFIV